MNESKPITPEVEMYIYDCWLKHIHKKKHGTPYHLDYTERRQICALFKKSKKTLGWISVDDMSEWLNRRDI